MQRVVGLLADHYAANKAYPPDLTGLPGAPFVDAWGRALICVNTRLRQRL
jgi:hypothetical protein